MGILLLACAGGGLEPAPSQTVAVHQSVAQSKVDRGDPLVVVLDVVVAGPGWQWDVEQPWPEGLEGGDPETLQDGDVTRLTWSLQAEPGSYVIEPALVRFVGPDGVEQLVEGSRQFVDVGVQGPTSQVQDIRGVELADPRNLPWGKLILGSAALLALAGAGVWFWTRTSAPIPEPPPRPESAAARLLRLWDAARADDTLDDHATALVLSQLYRDYVGARTGLKTDAMTTPELLAALEQSERFQPWTGVSKRLLQATDLIKFARAQASEALFDELDKALRAVVDATRTRPPL